MDKVKFEEALFPGRSPKRWNPSRLVWYNGKMYLVKDGAIVETPVENLD